ncbi:transcriptional regulator, RpiR family [Bhargavaea beijingensis]|uniref:Transcriptional regulator, RpiR family n=1 Tax=Bhargavaea beijingensis TaxID=426756 RepID=A0A1G7FUC1_9BACL|nr:MurR/RpiR family transcriptional regulator [Bhargavaea beijingensis]SDE79478.1 transcriptional regulator, RpiR family [Bhargavaea beijingensis]
MPYRERTEQHYDSLTLGLKKVGEALLANPILFATRSAKQIAEVLGVSETMIVRFSKAIGFDGFGELQKDIQQTLLAGPVVTDENPGDHENPFGQVMSSDVRNIQKAAAEMDAAVAGRFVDILAESETVQVVGYYQSFPFAHWFAFLLNTLTGTASLYRPETDIGIIKQGSDHCVVIFSYYRYAMGTIRLAEEARNNGNLVLVITDSSHSPVVRYADHTLVLPGAERSVLEKGPVTFSVMNTLLLHIAKTLGKLDFINPANQYYVK